MILSYAIAVNSIAVAKVQQIFGIHKFFDEKIKKAAPKDGYTLHITHYTLHITHYTYHKLNWPLFCNSDHFFNSTLPS